MTDKKPARTGGVMRCDQCEALMINGVFCHETECPNARKVWVDGEWVRFIACGNCGCDVAEGETCDCQDEPEGCDECMTYPCSCDDEGEYSWCSVSGEVAR